MKKKHEKKAKNDLCNKQKVRAKYDNSASVHILSSIGNTFSNGKTDNKKLIQLTIWETK
jgi:hypothetical protein